MTKCSKTITRMTHKASDSTAGMHQHFKTTWRQKILSRVQTRARMVHLCPKSQETRVTRMHKESQWISQWSMRSTRSIAAINLLARVAQTSKDSKIWSSRSKHWFCTHSLQKKTKLTWLIIWLRSTKTSKMIASLLKLPTKMGRKRTLRNTMETQKSQATVQP